LTKSTSEALRTIVRQTLWLGLVSGVLWVAAAQAVPVRDGGPYVSALSLGSLEAAAAPNPLCNQKECTAKNRCRGSQVLSHCDLSSGTCVTESCTR
jgi:hypothetical protein